MLRTPIAITGSGRTDTGVHCQQQFFHIDSPTTLDVADFQYKINAFLPYDISIQAVKPVIQEAHARFSATTRQYEYHITTVKDPFLKDLAYYFNKSLDIQTMNEAATLLIDRKDFKCFSKVKTEVDNFVCHITHAYWKCEGNKTVFNIAANRFLRGMVRAIVGTLLDVGQGRRSVASFSQTIASKDRKMAGRSAPAHGLYLTGVGYPNDIFIS